MKKITPPTTVSKITYEIRLTDIYTTVENFVTADPTEVDRTISEWRNDRAFRDLTATVREWENGMYTETRTEKFY